MPMFLNHIRTTMMRHLALWGALLIVAVFNPVPVARGDWLVEEVGDATGPDAGGWIELTPPAGDQVGAAWLDRPIDLDNGFDITLLVNLGDRDAGGADGLSIVFQNDPLGTDAVGDTSAGGEWVGMHTIYPAFSIEIDTYQNAVRGDPVCDHVGVNEYIDASSLPNHAGASPVCASTSSSDIEDGLDHSVRLIWDSSATTLSVFFDGQQRLTYTNDVVANIFSGTSTAWFGVVGSTGGAYNRQQFKAILTSSELAVGKTVAPTAVDPSDTVTYTVVLQNNGSATAFVTQLADQLPAGFVYQPGTTAGLTLLDPSISGQVLTWSGNWLIQPGGSASLTFQAQASSIPGAYYNNVTLRGSNFTDLTTGNTARVIVGSDLSTSTKGVVDLNGGDAWPNDILQYTITLTETAGRDVTAVSLTDMLAPGLTSLNLHMPLPPGAVDSSTPGQVNISNITVPANGSVDIIFDVTIAGGTPHGTAIDNTATIINPLGIGAAPSAPTVLVTNTTPPAAGTKPLYLYSNLDLSRLPPGAQTEVRIRGRESATWTLSPSTFLPITIDGSAGSIPVTLWIRGGNNRLVTLILTSSAGQIGTLGPIAISSSSYPAAPFRFDVPIANPSALVDISQVQLTVDNVSTRRNRRVYVHPYRNNLHSRIDLESLTVIHVEPVEFYDAPYPGGSIVSNTPASGTIYIRARVRDPFGSFDIRSAALTLTTPTGVNVVNSAPMTEVAADVNGPFKIYELPYPNFPATWPSPVDYGFWTARVTAEEGTEGLVRHTNQGVIEVLSPPHITMLKSVHAHSDPVSGTTNPYSIPGAFMAYTILVQNHGGGSTDTDSVVVTDPIPANTQFFVGDLGLPSGPVAFAHNPAVTGLTFDPGTDLLFSQDGGSNYDLTVGDLSPDANGCDARITHIRINPKGAFNGSSITTTPEFTLMFRVRVQ